jgi:hypothetical protein
MGDTSGGTGGGIGDYAALAQTRAEANGQTPENGELDRSAAAGFQGLGNLLGGGQSAQNEMNYNHGAMVGSQTITAMAEARQRVLTAQQNETAAQALPSLAKSMDLPDTYVPYGQASARAGKVPNPEELLAIQKAYQNQQLQDPNVDNATKMRIAGAQHSEALLPHVEGPNGSFSTPLNDNGTGPYNPNQPSSDTNSPVHVGSQQIAVNAASNAQKAATTAAAPINAAAHASEAASAATRANATAAGASQLPPGWAKPPANQRYVAEPSAPAGTKPTDTQFYKLDAEGRPSYEAVPGSPRDPNAPQVATGREAAQYMRVVSSARTAATDMHNAAQLPVDTTMGLGVGSAPGKSLMQSTVDDFRNQVSSSMVHKLATTQLGLSRGLAGLETAGLVPNGTFTDKFDNYAPRDGDSVSDIAYKNASKRQVIENGAEVLKSNPRVAPQMNAEMDHIVSQVRADYPYTPQDALDFDKAPKGTSFQAFIKGRQQQDAKAPASAPAGGINGPAPYGGGPAPAASGGHPPDIQALINQYATKKP